MNYVTCVIRILELQNVKFISKNIACIKLVVQLPEDFNKSSIIELLVWEDNMEHLLKFYKSKNVILIYGYLSGIITYKYIYNTILIEMEIIKVTTVKTYPIKLN